MKKVFLVHGWSVTETTTYQALHLKLAESGFELNAVHLGRYVSLDDHVTIRDLARGLHQALIDTLGDPPWNDEFHFITHSTGALIVRDWLLSHYTGQALRNRPVGNIVFLAGPHFGSRLAHHGRSMLASIKFLGPTGRSLLRALELGSPFAWENNGAWGDGTLIADKGIRPYCLSGDKVKRSKILSKIVPAGFESGSDMVVRVPAANMNFQRYRLDAAARKLTPTAVVEGVPFGALDQYVHSGPEQGIMNSITRRADPDKPRWQNLKLILDCLSVTNAEEYRVAGRRLAQISARRKHRGPFAQLVFRFVDQDGKSIGDYRFILGQVVKGKDKAASCVEHIHKNKTDPSFLVAFINSSKLDHRFRYYLEFTGSTESPLTRFAPDDFRVELTRDELKGLIRPDHSTEIEVTLPRVSDPELFRFHPGDDPDLHIKWDRQGQPVKTGIKPK